MSFSEAMETDEKKLVKTLNTNKVLLNEHAERNIFSSMKNRVSTISAVTFFNLSRIFQLPGLSKLSRLLIECSFLSAAESQSFLELDFASVARLLSSSELLVDSELQVLYVADHWLVHKKAERIERGEPPPQSSPFAAVTTRIEPRSERNAPKSSRASLRRDTGTAATETST